jgi:hypothetical protein
MVGVAEGVSVGLLVKLFPNSCVGLAVTMNVGDVDEPVNNSVGRLVENEGDSLGMSLGICVEPGIGGETLPVDGDPVRW